jgi:ABC-2 type transport system ATP-binding protein
MAALMTAVAEEGLSVLLSSHVVAELSRVCDYLVVLARGAVQMVGDVEDLLAGHQVLTGPTSQADTVAAALPVIGQRRAQRRTTLLVRASSTMPLPPDWQVEPTNLEELVLSYLRAPEASALLRPAITEPSRIRTAS